MNSKTLFGLTAAAATLSACLFEGQPSDPARVSVQMDIKAAASQAALAKSAGLILGDTAGTWIDLQSAKLAVSRIKLESESVEDECHKSGALRKDGDDDSLETDDERECEDEHELALKGPFVIDLLTGASTPDLGTLSVPAGLYDKVKIEMHHGDKDTALGGRTLTGSGILHLADGTAKPFTLALTFDENLKVRADSGMTLDAGAVRTVAVKLMAADWLKGVDMAGCLAKADPAAAVLEISEESALGKCLDVEHLVKENFRDSFRADRHHDDDDDGDDRSGKGK